MPGRLVWRQPARHRPMDRGWSPHRAEQDKDPVVGDDPVGRSHCAAAVRCRARRSGTRVPECDSSRFAARPYRHGGERTRKRALLDAADRVVEIEMTLQPRASFDWRVPLIWAVMLAISVFAHA